LFWLGNGRSQRLTSEHNSQDATGEILPRLFHKRETVLYVNWAADMA
jgi:hypothetical protein